MAAGSSLVRIGLSAPVASRIFTFGNHRQCPMKPCAAGQIVPPRVFSAKARIGITDYDSIFNRTNIMKNVIRPRLFNHQRGFSLVEMIGVLAIIAILAVVIVPKVFSTIASSRVTNAVGSITSVKSAVTDFSGRYGTVPLTTANSRFDDLLITTGLLDSRFVVKIGTQPANPIVAGAVWTNVAGVWTAAGGASQAAQSRIISLVSSVAAPSAAAGANFRLDGVTDLPANSLVLSAVIVGITAIEAQSLSLKIDGAALSQPTTATADNNGMVVYAAPVAGITTAYVYLTYQ